MRADGGFLMNDEGSGVKRPLILFHASKAATRLSAIIHPPSYIAASGYRSSDILHQLCPYAELEIPTGWALYYRGAWAVGW